MEPEERHSNSGFCSFRFQPLGFVHIMGDVKLVTSTRVSKTSLTLSPPVPAEAPAFTLPPRNIRVQLGTTARFEGKVRGYPEPQITWYRNGHPVPEGDHYVMDRSIRGIFSLVIKDVQEGDSGKYTCEAANDGGIRQVTVELTVEGNSLKKYSLPSSAKTPGGRLTVPSVEHRPSIWGESPPKFATKPNRVVVREGQTGKFSCKITGRPQPQVTWFKGDIPLQQNERFNMFEKTGIQFLEIQNAQLADSGVYTCTVVNRAGKASVSAELTVQGPDKTDTYAQPPCMPPKPTTLAVKAIESSEFKQATSNGIAKELKSSSTELMVETKDRASVRKETLYITREAKDSKQGQHQEAIAVSPPEPKEGKKGSQVLQKTSSTITLQAVKLQPEPKAEPQATFIRQSEDRRRAVQPLVSAQQTLSLTGQLSQRSREGENRSGARKTVMEEKREPLGIPPQFESCPQSLEASEGQEIKFKSKVSGKPKPDVEWFKEGEPIKAGEDVQIYEEDGIHCLWLKKACLGDSGSYSCAAFNPKGQTSTSWLLTVRRPKVQEVAPCFSSVLKGCTVSEGEDFVLQCCVRGVPVPQITWLLNDQPIQYADSTFEDGIAKLTVQDALPEDDGFYTCLAENNIGQASCSAQVTVKEKKSSKKAESTQAAQLNKTFAPIFLKGLTDLKVMDGSQVIMTVEVSANPPPEIIWLHNGKEIQETEDFHFEKKGNEYSLYIQEVFPEDTGKYTCEAWNELGETQTQATLTVQEPQDGIQPWFISKPRSVTAAPGQNVLISCAIAGDPFPTVHWFKDGQEIMPGMTCEILQNEDIFTLILRNVQSHHAGQYEIQLRNQVGECSCQVSLMLRESSASRAEMLRDGRESASSGEQRDGGDHGKLTFDRTSGFKKNNSETRAAEEEQEDVRGVLKRRVETREHTEESLRQQEAEQLDFRDILGKKVSTKSFSEEELKEIPAEQMDFRANLQRQVKPKTLSEEERKVHAPQQVDFRSVLAKKGTPKTPLPEKAPPPKPAITDFRSVLGSKKKPPAENGSASTPAANARTSSEAQNATPNSQAPVAKPALKKEEKNDRNREHGCPVVDGGIIGKKVENKAATSNPPASKPPVSNAPASNLPASKPPVSNPPESKPPASKPPVSNLPASKPPVSNPPESKPPVSNPPESKPPASKPPVSNPPASKPPVSKGTAPSFTEKLQDAQVVDGEKLVLQCRISSDPPAAVTWTLDSKPIKSSKSTVISQEGTLCSLTIEKAVPEDGGEYKCIAENAAGKAECACKVSVEDASAKTSKSAEKKTKKPKTTLPPVLPTESEATVKKKPAPKTPPKAAVPPQITQFPEDRKVRAGESVELFAKVVGTTPITCTWMKFRKQIEENEYIKIENAENSSKLTITSTKQEHCGCYTLVVENKLGSRQAQVNLTVVDKPDPPAGTPCASDVRSSSLTLSWYGSSYDGGSAVQSYTVEIWNSVDNKWTDLTTCRSTSFNVQDLQADREYKFRVRAANVYGISEPSQESELVKVGEKQEEELKEDEAELSDDEGKETEVEYRTVTINTEQKVSDVYNIEERLGSGKFGQVFRLVEKKTGKVWAGKFFKAYSAKEKENIRDEISIMNCLHHPKLVQCVDAFEEKANIVMVLEMVSGGELFERIIDEDFELTERECIKYMKQISEGVQYIHKQGIVHLDLKPENIMCVNKTGTSIKLIDFGLARRLENAGSLKVLFGTPEFVAPEVINYEPIGYETDMWSIGVICYILVSGLSPFMGDNDNETLANVTSATWDFDDEAFDEISDDAKDFISNLLKKDMKSRLNCTQCLQHPWLQKDTKNMEAKKLSKDRMKKYMARRKWQKTGHAVRAIGRLSSMAMISGMSGRKASGSSPTSPINADKVENEDAFLEEVAEEKPHVKPYFTKTILDLEVVEGSAARFDCKIEGYPDPEVMWYKDDQPVKESRHFQIDYDEEGNCSLTISEVCGDDDAKYTCKAVNSLGEATCTAELLVETMAEGEGEGEDEDEEEEEE
ncbi:myosin light chain kinase, smooth muscle isoform X2 [Columba livia]|uniref:myosin light chain kinase, smooth muscle isoform X2 n=1 Tax=Columba livia TaxID=8932 RepID=UPI0031BBB0A1